MATSGTTNWVVNREQLIKRALRLCGALGQGDLPTPAQLEESNQALNDLIKEWQADGMQLWKIVTIPITLVAGQASYSIGTGSAVNFPSPLKALNAYMSNLQGEDIPLVAITRSDYELLSNKTEQGTPNQYWYNPPGNLNTGEMIGTLTLFNTPNAFAVTNYTVQLVGLQPIEDMTSDTQIPDIPSYYQNALTWGLADQLAYENPTPVSVQDRITKKAMYHKDKALGFDVEEGSVNFQPDPFWMMESNHLRG